MATANASLKVSFVESRVSLFQVNSEMVDGFRDMDVGDDES